MSLLQIHLPNDDQLFPGWLDMQLGSQDTPDGEWAVEKIEGHIGSKTDTKFQIKWKLGNITWMPYYQIQNLDALKAYLELQGVKKIHDLPADMALASSQVHAKPPISWVGNNMGMGNTVDIWSWVCSGTGTGSRLAYPDNTIPFFMVLQVCWYQDSSHVTLLIGYTFVYNDVCSPSNAPPSPQKRDRGLCFSGASPSLTLRRQDDEAQMMESSFGPWFFFFPSFLIFINLLIFLLFFRFLSTG